MDTRKKYAIFCAVALLAIVLFVSYGHQYSNKVKDDYKQRRWQRIDLIQEGVEGFLLGEDIWISDEKLRSIAIDIYERDDYAYDKEKGITIDEAYLNTLRIILEEE